MNLNKSPTLFWSNFKSNKGSEVGLSLHKTLHKFTRLYKTLLHFVNSKIIQNHEEYGRIKSNILKEKEKKV